MADTDQSAVVQELYRRRDSLDPDKRAVVEELAKRMNVAQPEKTGFFGRIGENLTGLKDLAVGAVTHPIDTAKAMLTPDPTVSKEAADAFNRGDYGRYAGSQIEAIPLIGPQIRRTEQDLRKGDYGAIGGDVATAATLSQLPRVASAIPRAGAAVSEVLMSPGVIKGLKRSTEGVIVGSAMHGNVPGVAGGVIGRLGAGMLENAAERRAAAKLPPAAASIVEKAQAAPPLTAAEQALADHIMANVEPEAAAPPAAGPASIPQGPADMPAPRAGQVGQSAMPATPAAALQMPGPQGAPVPASPAEAVSQASRGARTPARTEATAEATVTPPIGANRLLPDETITGVHRQVVEVPVTNPAAKPGTTFKYSVIETGSDLTGRKRLLVGIDNAGNRAPGAFASKGGMLIDANGKIQSVYLDPDVRGSGIFKGLMDFAESKGYALDPESPQSASMMRAMQKRGAAPEGQAPQVQVIPSPEPAVAKEVYVAKAQAAKSTKMADVLHQLEITPEQVPTISDADWTRIEKATKINRPNSPESLQMVVGKLQNLQKPSAAAEVPEALRKNPKAMAAARALAAEQAK